MTPSSFSSEDTSMHVFCVIFIVNYWAAGFVNWPPRTHWWLVRWPGNEDPLISLSILGIQAEEDVAGFLRCEQGKQELIIILVPTLRWLSTPIQHQLLCRWKKISWHTWASRRSQLKSCKCKRHHVFTVSDDYLHYSDGTSSCTSQKLFQLRCCWGNQI